MHLVSGETFTDSHTSSSITEQHQQTVIAHFYTVLLQKQQHKPIRQPVWINTTRHYTLIFQQPVHTLRFSECIHSTLVFTYISVLRSQRFSFLRPLGEHDLTVCHIQPSLRRSTTCRHKHDGKTMTDTCVSQWHPTKWKNSIPDWLC